MNSLAPINDINLKIFDEICEERFSKLDLECILVSIIDNVPSDALPHLAEQYHITGNEGWLQAKTEDEKRALIKNSIKLHRYKGTKYGLLETLKTLSLTPTIKEWFEYGGDPYHFRVQFDVDTLFEETFENEILDLINENKNVRSVLESLIFHLMTKAKIRFTSAVVTFEEIIV